MDLPQVDSCCFGLLPLKTGALIAAIVTLIVEAGVQGYQSYYVDDWLRSVMYVLVVLGVISSVLLIFGILMNNKLFAQIYLIVFALLIVGSIACLVLVMMRHHGNLSNYIVSSVVYLCVVIYCLIVVNSYYATM